MSTDTKKTPAELQLNEGRKENYEDAGLKPKPTRRRRSRVIHYFWKSEAASAREMGIHEVPAVCRRAWVSTANEVTVTVVRGAAEEAPSIQNATTRDCKVCMAMYKAEARRWFS